MPEPIKILFLSSSDSNGGAAKAAFRLFNGLREQGLSVKMLVRDKHMNDPDVISCFDYNRKGFSGKFDHFIWKVKNRIRKQKWKKYPNREPVFLNDLDSISLIKAIKSIDFDILHLHFVANRFLNLKELKKIDKPIVWTLHDSWAFTGICHYFYDCTRYEQSCGSCPMLHSNYPYDYTYSIWKEKNKIYKKCTMHIITPSNWLGACASKSSLLHKFPLKVIPNGIDTQFYRPIPMEEARKNIGIMNDKHFLLFGAVNATSDTNKGFDLLVDALKYLVINFTMEIELIIFGVDKFINIIDFCFPITFLGVINDENMMVDFYNAANVVLLPSRSENFSNTILESMACGTPVVAFDIGGNADLIEHKQNGYLAAPFKTDDLAQGIAWCLENNNEMKLLAKTRVKVLENYTFEKVAHQYHEFYKSLIN